MIDGSSSNDGVSKQSTSDILSRIKSDPVLIGLLVLAGLLLIQTLWMRAQLVGLRASIQARSPANTTRELLAQAEQSLAKGDRDVAKVYFLNAVAKAPEDFDALKRYAEIVLDRDSADPGEVDRLRSVLQAASYQVAPRHVPSVLQLLGKVVSMEKNEVDLGVDTPGSSAASLNERLNELQSIDIEIWKDRSELDQHVEQLRLLADQVDVGNPEDVALLKKIRQEEQRWAAIVQTVRTAEFLDSCFSSLQLLETNSQLDSEEAVALVQAAEQMLVGFWGVDAALLPEQLKTKRHAFPTTIRQFVDKIANLRSQPYLAKIESLCSEAEANAPVPGKDGKTHQDRINWLEEQLGKSQEMIVEIKSAEALKKAQKRLMDVQKMLAKTRRDQFNSYQQFAIARAEEVYKKFNNSWVVSEANAEGFFEAGKLYEIDQSILSPEVSRILSDLLGKLFAELSPAKLVQLEAKMGNPELKVNLEKF